MNVLSSTAPCGGGGGGGGCSDSIDVVVSFSKVLVSRGDLEGVGGCANGLVCGGAEKGKGVAEEEVVFVLGGLNGPCPEARAGVK